MQASPLYIPVMTTKSAKGRTAARRTVITVAPEMHARLKAKAKSERRFLEAVVEDLLVAGFARELAGNASKKETDR